MELSKFHVIGDRCELDDWFYEIDLPPDLREILLHFGPGSFYHYISVGLGRPSHELDCVHWVNPPALPEGGIVVSEAGYLSIAYFKEMGCVIVDGDLEKVSKPMSFWDCVNKIATDYYPQSILYQVPVFTTFKVTARRRYAEFKIREAWQSSTDTWASAAGVWGRTFDCMMVDATEGLLVKVFKGGGQKVVDAVCAHSYPEDQVWPAAARMLKRHVGPIKWGEIHGNPPFDS
jgi:hypothetical protein